MRVRAARPRAPAAVLLKLLTQRSKARQRRPPSARPPPPARLLGRRRRGGRGRGGRASAGRRLPRAVPRVLPAPTARRPAPSTKGCLGASGRESAAATRALAAAAPAPSPATPKGGADPRRPPPSRAVQARVGLEPSTHPGAHVRRGSVPGAGVRPRAGRAWAPRAPGGRWTATAVAEATARPPGPARHRVSPARTLQGRPWAAGAVPFSGPPPRPLGHVLAGSFKPEPLEDPRGAVRKTTREGATLKMASRSAGVAWRGHPAPTSGLETPRRSLPVALAVGCRAEPSVPWADRLEWPRTDSGAPPSPHSRWRQTASDRVRPGGGARHGRRDLGETRAHWPRVAGEHKVDALRPAIGRCCRLSPGGPWARARGKPGAWTRGGRMDAKFRRALRSRRGPDSPLSAPSGASARAHREAPFLSPGRAEGRAGSRNRCRSTRDPPASRTWPARSPRTCQWRQPCGPRRAALPAGTRPRRRPPARSHSGVPRSPPSRSPSATALAGAASSQRTLRAADRHRPELVA